MLQCVGMSDGITCDDNIMILQISQSSSSPHLSNIRQFPKFLRTVSSDIEIAQGISLLMKHFSWSRVALLTQSENIFTFVSLYIYGQAVMYVRYILRSTLQFSAGFKEHITNSSLNFLEEYLFNTDDSKALLQRINKLQVIHSIEILNTATLFIGIFQKSPA